MTRIIGGEAGGRRLRTPAGEATRPTSDRVREALFSALDSALGSLHGLGFLDLYAGSGAVGLEARSRGAAPVTLVEQDRRTAAVIRANVAAVALDRVEVVASPVLRALDRSPHVAYDVAFLDPPYAEPVAQVGTVLAALHRHHWLAAEAVVVVERSRRGSPMVWPPGYEPQRSRAYGETLLWYGRATV
ncbi:MAG: 16S rRNA (guanine(966)-N(2))-methyltransferase RsmD [Nocardioidaceae bacterium]